MICDVKISTPTRVETHSSPFSTIIEVQITSTACRRTAQKMMNDDLANLANLANLGSEAIEQFNSTTFYLKSCIPTFHCYFFCKCMQFYFIHAAFKLYQSSNRVPVGSSRHQESFRSHPIFLVFAHLLS